MAASAAAHDLRTGRHRDEPPYRRSCSSPPSPPWSWGWSWCPPPPARADTYAPDLRRGVDLEPGRGRRLARRHPRQRRGRQLRRHRLDRRPLAVHPGARSTSRTPRSRSRTRRSPASRPRRRRGRTPTCRSWPAARRSCTTSRSAASGSATCGSPATTLAKIFTGAITRWSDPAIAADYGKALPDIPIIPVVRSDGAGASAQFTQVHGQPGVDDLLPVHPGQAAPQQRLPERVLLPGVRQLQGAGRLQRRRPTTSPRRTAPARSATSSTPTPSGSTSRSSGCSTRRATTRSRPRATSRSR